MWFIKHLSAMTTDCFISQRCVRLMSVVWRTLPTVLESSVTYGACFGAAHPVAQLSTRSRMVVAIAVIVIARRTRSISHFQKSCWTVWAEMDQRLHTEHGLLAAQSKQERMEAFSSAQCRSPPNQCFQANRCDEGMVLILMCGSSPSVTGPTNPTSRRSCKTSTTPSIEPP